MNVSVHWNFHKKRFSLVYRGIVMAHCIEVVLHNAHFVVSEKGRARGLREKRKNVHARIRGRLMGWIGHATKRCTQAVRIRRGSFHGDFPEKRVSYNPYKNGTFVYTTPTGTSRKYPLPILESSRVVASVSTDDRAKVFAT